MWADVLPYAAGLEGSALGVAARTSLWLYPLANLLHVLGAALVVGAIATFDVQILRRAPDAGRVVRAGIPIAVAGLLLQLTTGVVLVAAETTTVLLNPAFGVKMAALLLALLNIAWFHLRFRHAVAADGPLAAARPLAAISLLAWTVVLLGGRAIAYV